MAGDFLLKKYGPSIHKFLKRILQIKIPIFKNILYNLFDAEFVKTS